MRLLQSIRFRIVIACVIFSIIVTVGYGWVTFYGVNYNSDELFNWHISQEAAQLIAEYEKNATLTHVTTANVFVSDEQHALTAAANYFVDTQTRAKFTQVNAFKDVRVPGPKFTTEQGYIMYEFSADNKTLHVLQSALPKNETKQFYYMVDVSNFINYDNHSEAYIAKLFLKILVFIMVLALAIGFILAKMVVSPLTRLANSVDGVDHQNYLKSEEKYFNDEIGFLAKRIDSFVSRTHDFVEREKAFSRDVSHELRTPVASSRAAIELALSTPEGQSGRLNKFLLRVSRANRDMTHLIETFLLLGREEQKVNATEGFNLHELVNQSFAKHDYLKRSVEVKCQNNIDSSLNIVSSKQHLAIVLDNLVRNALQHTHDGSVSVLFENQQLIVRDTGDGMSEQRKQSPSTNVMEKSGVGLNIVRRLSEKQHWQMHVKSKLGQGTSVYIDMSNSG